MSLEIELKMKVDGHDSIRQRLDEIKAHAHGRVLEVNHIYDRPDRVLLKRDEGLRVRAVTPESESEASRITLTYKGPRESSDYKARPELEIVVSQEDAACAILEALDYERVITFEKRRETWSYRECRIELDELPCLGTFVEIEGPNAKAIAAVRAEAGLDAAKAVADNYIALLMDHCRQSGRSANRIRFENSSMAD